MRTLVGLLVLACALTAAAADLGYQPRDPYGPLDPAVIENWARPPTPEEQARYDELREAYRNTYPTGNYPGAVPPPKAKDRWE